MSRQELEIPGARLQGSGGFFLFLTKIIQDILDEESKFSNMRKNNNNVHPGNKREPRDEPIASQSLRIGISATHKAVQEITHIAAKKGGNPQQLLGCPFHCFWSPHEPNGPCCCPNQCCADGNPGACP